MWCFLMVAVQIFSGHVLLPNIVFFTKFVEQLDIVLHIELEVAIYKLL